MLFKKMYLLLFLISGVILSGVAAVYSVSGLVSIFKGAPLAITIMGITLESIKVLISIYIHSFWKTLNKFLLSYLTIALLILMFITSLGVYGYLSRAFSTSTDTAGLSTKINSLQFSIEIEREKIKANQDQIGSINQIPKEERKSWHYWRIKSLSDEIGKYTEKIDSLNSDLLTEKTKMGDLESEVGPLKYLSKLIYGKEDYDSVKNSVQIFIIMIVSVFDPLAILSIISAIHGWNNIQEKKQIKEEKEKVVEEKEPFIKYEPTVIEIPNLEIKKNKKKYEEIKKENDSENIENIIPTMVSSYHQDDLEKMYNSTPRTSEGFK